MKLLMVVLLSWFNICWGLTCDCEVRAFPPLTGPLSAKTIVLDNLSLNDFDSINSKNVTACLASCKSELQKEMTSGRLKLLLEGYAGELIDAGLAGYNCTGLTTFKFPVRAKASLAGYHLGQVMDQVQVITLEKSCFPN